VEFFSDFKLSIEPTLNANSAQAKSYH